MSFCKHRTGGTRSYHPAAASKITNLCNTLSMMCRHLTWCYLQTTTYINYEAPFIRVNFSLKSSWWFWRWEDPFLCICADFVKRQQWSKRSSCRDTGKSFSLWVYSCCYSLVCDTAGYCSPAQLLTCSWLRVVVRQVKPVAIFSTMTVKGRKEKGRNAVGGHATMSPMMTSVFQCQIKMQP